MGKKVFRHSPHRGADAIRILAGTKTNATIRDLEETIEDIEEKEAVVVSIDKDKINGTGWTVKDEEGNTYLCNCASNMYQLPETEEYGGVYYPTNKVTVKITINPVLGTNTITEITSLGEDETSLDLSQWKHEDKSTTIIAKPKSAISISDAIISFNYNNTNEVTVDEDEITAAGKKTSVTTNRLEVNSNDIKIQNQDLFDFLSDQMWLTLSDDTENYKYDGIDVIKQNNLGQINLNIKSTYIPSEERILKDLKDPSLYPEKVQRHPLFTGDNIDELYIYPNGLVTVRSRGAERYDADVFNTYNWAMTPYIYKNLLNVSVVKVCDCCTDGFTGTRTYFNYCPVCKTWTTLYNNNNVISCSSCNTNWCQGCGHPYNFDCTNKTYDLKTYSQWNISAISTPCDYCKNEISYGKLREYANYCPKCHTWGYLKLETQYKNGEEKRFFRCTNSKCNELYCVNCSISQGESFIKNFINDNTIYYYTNFMNNYFKIKHIRDD